MFLPRSTLDVHGVLSAEVTDYHLRCAFFACTVAVSAWRWRRRAWEVPAHGGQDRKQETWLAQLMGERHQQLVHAARAIIKVSILVGTATLVYHLQRTAPPKQNAGGDAPPRLLVPQRARSSLGVLINLAMCALFVARPTYRTVQLITSMLLAPAFCATSLLVFSFGADDAGTQSRVMSLKLVSCSFVNVMTASVNSPGEFVYLQAVLSITFQWVAGFELHLMSLACASVNILCAFCFFHNRRSWTHEEARLRRGHEARAAAERNADAAVKTKELRVLAGQAHAARLDAEKDRAVAMTRSEAERATTRFFFHVFRNDLNLVQGAIASVPPGKVRASLLGAARRGVRHMAALVRNLKDMNRLRTGDLVLPCRPFALDRMCADLAADLGCAHPALRVSAACPPGATGWGSQLHVTIVLKNLLNNAAKFTSRRCRRDPAGGPGFVRLTVTRVREDEGEDEGGGGDDDGANRFRFVVEDSGPGIPQESQTRVFLQYKQAGGFQPGTGLGLPLSQALVELMGGRLALTSPYRAGHSGARFAFAIGMERPPAARDDDEGEQAAAVDEEQAGRAAAAAAAEAAAAAAAALPDRARVLIADDEPLNNLVMRMLLSTIAPNWTVDEATTATDVVALVRKGKHQNREYDVLLLDENFGFARGRFAVCAF